jgi:O-antigen ligase
MREPFVLACLAFYALFIIGMAWTTTPEHAPRMLKKMHIYLFAPALFVACADLRVRRAIFFGFLAAAALSLVLSIVSWLTGTPLGIGAVGNWLVFRTHTYHNLFVLWMAMAALAALLTGLLAGWRARLAAAVIAFAVFDILFLVQGRTGHLLLVMAIPLVLYLWDRRRGLRLGIAVLVVGLPAAWLASDMLRERFTKAIDESEVFVTQGGQETSVGFRLSWARDTLPIIARAPVLGHGTGSFETEFRRAHGASLDLTVDEPPLKATSNPHSDYLWIATELGIVGVISLLAVFFAALRAARRLPRASSIVAWVIVSTIAVGSVMNSFVTDNITGTGYMLLLFAVLGGPVWPERSAGREDHA